MATLSDEQLRALRFLVRHPGGCTEAMLEACSGCRHVPMIYAAAKRFDH
jgi:hypothetical protein